MTLAVNILGLAKSLLGLVDKLRKVDRERRERIARLFENMRTSLVAASEEIRNGGVPHGLCSELSHHAESLADLIRIEVGSDQAEELEHAMTYVCPDNTMALVFASEQEKSSCLKILDEASGKFRALVNILLSA